MTIQTASIAAAPKQRTTRIIIAAAGTILALSAVAGIGAWQASRDGGTSTREQQAPSVPAPATVRTITSRVSDTTPTYYLVASQAQAAAAEAALEEANALRMTSGEATLTGRVEQLTSVEAEGTFRQAMNTADATRATLGLPPVRVIDLRSTNEPGATATVRIGTAGEGSAPLGGMAELSVEQQRAAQTVTALLDRMGGMAELYRQQAQERGGTSF